MNEGFMKHLKETIVQPLINKQCAESFIDDLGDMPKADKIEMFEKAIRILEERY